MSATSDAIEHAVEQLSLVEGVLLEARDLHDRVNKGLQALAYARAALAEATEPKNETGGA